jgi:uncharacterized protein YjbI with pentapeptide repeats
MFGRIMGLSNLLAFLIGATTVVIVWLYTLRERLTFWAAYTRAASFFAFGLVAWLAYQVGTSTVSWWTSPATAALITALIGAIVPLTAFITNWAKIQLDDQKQKHEIAQAGARQAHEIAIAAAKQQHEIGTADAQQDHAITTDYLTKALDAELPLATRYQLLRFLATAPNKTRLQSWATAELRRIDPAYERLSRDQRAAQEAIASAKTVEELHLAQAKLKATTARAHAASGSPVQPSVSVEALKSGLFEMQEIGPVSFPQNNLDGAKLSLAKFAGSNFNGSSIRGGNLYRCVAPQTNFNGADLKDAYCEGADLRGSTFVDADLQGANLQQTRLEGADLTGASIDQANVMAVYSSSTKWPAGFDAKKAGCVLVDDPPELKGDGQAN